MNKKESSVRAKKIKFFGYRRLFGFYLSHAETTGKEQLYAFSLVLMNKPIANLIWTDSVWQDIETGKNYVFSMNNGVLFTKKLAIRFNGLDKKIEKE
ncbi:MULTISPECIES: hypothetical protein [unclassified Psychrobacillus]|uniref:hypothetical protein n=1 Tax=unclassified Psychrobacillus TaxID=2636677 RepID=UPI0030FB67BA